MDRSSGGEDCLVLFLWVWFFVESDAALSPRRATNFLLLRKKKVGKEKATLVSASLRFAAGNLRCSAQPGSRSNSLRSDNRGP